MGRGGPAAKIASSDAHVGCLVSGYAPTVRGALIATSRYSCSVRICAGKNRLARCLRAPRQTLITALPGPCAHLNGPAVKQGTCNPSQSVACRLSPHCSSVRLVGLELG